MALAARRLARLESAGLIHYRRIFHGAPAATWIRRRGLDAIEHRLPQPRPDLRGYQHDVGVGWLWLAARAGNFGELTGLSADREMRAADARAAAVLVRLPDDDVIAGGVAGDSRIPLGIGRIGIDLKLASQRRGR